MSLIDRIFGSKKDVESQNTVNNENEEIRNFEYLNSLIHGDVKEIALDSDIILSDGEESQYGEGIKLDVDDLVIEGNGHAIDARGLSRIFHCTGKNITIKNIILKNGFASEGGAIYNDDKAKLTITESTLTANTAKEGPGGAIYNNQGMLTITSSTLIKNASKESSGGAIFNDEGMITVTDSTLTGNTAQYYGGAVHNWGELIITNSTLEKNIAEKSGGAIYNNEAELTITESVLTKNTAKEGPGGAIHNYEEYSFNIKNCKVEDNDPDDID